MDQDRVYSVIMEWVGEEKTLGNGQCTWVENTPGGEFVLVRKPK